MGPGGQYPIGERAGGAAHLPAPGAFSAIAIADINQGAVAILGDFWVLGGFLSSFSQFGSGDAVHAQCVHGGAAVTPPPCRAAARPLLTARGRIQHPVPSAWSMEERQQMPNLLL